MAASPAERSQSGTWVGGHPIVTDLQDEEERSRNKQSQPVESPIGLFAGSTRGCLKRRTSE